METTSHAWFYVVAGRHAGSVSDADIRAMIRDGRLDSDTLVWTADMPEWESAAIALPSHEAAVPATVESQTVPPQLPVQSAEDKLASQATASMILGLISIFGLFVPVMLLAGIIGLVLGIRSLSSAKRNHAIAGIVLSGIGLLVVAWLAYAFVDVIRHVGFERFRQEFFAPTH